MERLAKLQETMEDLKVERQFEQGLRNLVRGRHELQYVYGGDCFDEWGMYALC